MKAIISINYVDFLVPDAKRALAFVEMMEKAQVIDRTYYKPNEYRLSGGTARVEMRVLPPAMKIIPAKTKAAKA